MARTKTQSGHVNETKRKWFRVLRNFLISFGLAVLATVVIVGLVPLIFKMTLIPANVGSIVLLLVLLTIVYFVMTIIVSFFRGTKTKKSIILGVGMLVGTILMVIAVYIASTFLFLNSTQIGEYSNGTYAIVVKKDSGYAKIDELKNRKIGVLDTNEDLGAFETLEQGTGLNFQIVAVNDGVSQLSTMLLNNEAEAINVEQGRLQFLYDEVENFENDTKVIYTYKSQNKTYKSETTTTLNGSFVVYISGIDQFGKTDSVVGRSDVNQLMVVNPKTHEILFVNTPRDYYVQLAGTTGLKDKLTHAGVYGIETSIKTLEELYDVKIDYYVRVNFDSLIKVVDQIGGIDIVSDQEFTAWTDHDVHVEKGWNHFNGKQALAYARERYAYEDGDRHRGENQQQVMSAIIDKITQSSTLLKNYNSILQALNGSFQTDMNDEEIIDFMQKQFAAKNTKWKIQTISVDGIGSMQPTYSMGANLPLYVMIPDEGTLAQARNRINEIVEE